MQKNASELLIKHKSKQEKTLGPRFSGYTFTTWMPLLNRLGKYKVNVMATLVYI
jgi:hypothetical protein